MLQRQAAEQWATRYPAARVITTVAVVTVALIAAVVSYSHMHDLAASVGEHWRSYLIPISIDGMIVAASMTLLTRHRAGLKGSTLAWVALIGGVIASVAANMADARNDYVAILLAGSAPLVFAIGFELLLLQRHADRLTTETPSSAGMPAESAKSSTPAPPPVDPSPAVTASTPPVPTKPKLPTPVTTRPTAQSVSQVVPAAAPPTVPPAQEKTLPRARPAGVVGPRPLAAKPGPPITSRTMKRANELAAAERKAEAWLIFDADPDMQHTRIASRLGVSEATVRNYRKAWEAERLGTGSPMTV